MIYCLSCEKYPTDVKVIPYGSSFPVDTFKVKLLTDTVPQTMPEDGSDVEGLADGTKFAVGSLLFVTTGENNSETYVYVDSDTGFQKWDSNIDLD